ncbi:MAG: exodeoxyribonuclease V subunit alpha [Gammaproteobacteria bacterium]|nr:exodeoxyribonuclease V subunit alpha [Gammaproteobacteria bacterium]
MAAALASAATGRGHTGLATETLVEQAAPWLGPDESADDLVARLHASPVCGDGTEPTPLVRDARRIYLYRYWNHERQLADALNRRNAPAGDAPAPAALKASLDRLFPPAGGDAIDWQKVAAALAALRRLAIISGGPGTGKTSTVVRILALLLEQAAGECRIALAAPTGKAAARMEQAIAEAREAITVDQAARDAIPGEAVTVHRLLGAGVHGRFRHDANNPLPVDVLVVDEVSMVDLALMVRLEAALPAHARLVLLGDRDQLASVEPGSVFAELCLGANGFSAPVAADLGSATGFDVPPRGVEVLPDCAVALERGYRFTDDSGIGALAAAVRDGDAERALDLLGDERGEATRIDIAAGQDIGDVVAERLLPEIRERLALIAAGAAPEAVFARYGAMQVLAPLREGPRGVGTINREIERLLSAEGLVGDETWYPGRPVPVTVNDYAPGLVNGDLGVIMPWGEAGEARACFPGEGGPRWLHPPAFPPTRPPGRSPCTRPRARSSTASRW